MNEYQQNLKNNLKSNIDWLNINIINGENHDNKSNIFPIVSGVAVGIISVFAIVTTSIFKCCIKPDNNIDSPKNVRNEITKNSNFSINQYNQHENHVDDSNYSNIPPSSGALQIYEIEPKPKLFGQGEKMIRFHSNHIEDEVICDTLSDEENDSKDKFPSSEFSGVGLMSSSLITQPSDSGDNIVLSTSGYQPTDDQNFPNNSTENIKAFVTPYFEEGNNDFGESSYSHSEESLELKSTEKTDMMLQEAIESTDHEFTIPTAPDGGLEPSAPPIETNIY